MTAFMRLLPRVEKPDQRKKKLLTPIMSSIVTAWQKAVNKRKIQTNFTDCRVN